MLFDVSLQRELTWIIHIVLTSAVDRVLIITKSLTFHVKNAFQYV